MDKFLLAKIESLGEKLTENTSEVSGLRGELSGVKDGLDRLNTLMAAQQGKSETHVTAVGQQADQTIHAGGNVVAARDQARAKNFEFSMEWAKANPAKAGIGATALTAIADKLFNHGELLARILG